MCMCVCARAFVSFDEIQLMCMEFNSIRLADSDFAASEMNIHNQKWIHKISSVFWKSGIEHKENAILIENRKK